MAVTTVGSPIGGGDLSPVYNPIVWYFNSTEKIRPGYRYVVDVFEKTGPSTQSLLTRLEIAPRPDDGYCVADIGRILSNYVTNELITSAHASESSNSYIRYNIEVRDKYLLSYQWTSYGQATGATGDNQQLTVLNFDSATPFIANDQIVSTTSDGGVEQPLLGGILTVVEVISPTAIVVNREWSVISQNVPDPGPSTLTGDVIYADGRKFTSDVELTIEDKQAFNGAISHFELSAYSPTRFTMGTINPNNRQLLTTIPSTFTVREGTRLGLNVWNNFLSSATFNYVYLENNTGTIKRRVANSTTFPVMFIPCGPGNIENANYTLVSGPNDPIIDTDTKWYQMWIANAAGVRVSKIYRFNIDRTCSKFDELEVVFLDRLGSLGSFTFYYRADNFQQITRETQNYILGDLNTDTELWGFNTQTGIGSRTSFVELENTVSLTTAWLTQDESKYFQELVSSPQAWIKIESLIGVNYYPLIITDTQSQLRDKRVDKNVRYTINARYSNSETINW